MMRWRMLRRGEEEDTSVLPRLICLLSSYRLTAHRLIVIRVFLVQVVDAID